MRRAAALKRPTVELGDRHERDAKEVSLEKLAIEGSKTVLLEQIGDDGRVDEQSVHERG